MLTSYSNHFRASKSSPRIPGGIWHCQELWPLTHQGNPTWRKFWCPFKRTPSLLGIFAFAGYFCIFGLFAELFEAPNFDITRNFGTSGLSRYIWSYRNNHVLSKWATCFEISFHFEITLVKAAVWFWASFGGLVHFLNGRDWWNHHAREDISGDLSKTFIFSPYDGVTNRFIRQLARYLWFYPSFQFSFFERGSTSRRPWKNELRRYVAAQFTR
jgi:hypothetical protein